MELITEHISNIFKDYYNVDLSDQGKEVLQNWIEKYSLDEVLEACEMAFNMFDDEISIFLAMGIILHQRQKIKVYFDIKKGQ